MYEFLKRITRGTVYLKYGRQVIRDFFIEAGREMGDPIDLLDIGCASCDDLMNLKSGLPGKQVRLHGLDFRPREHYRVPPEVDFKTGNVELEPLPFPDGSMDFVVCNQIFEHCKEIYFMTSEISRVLKKGGYAVIGVPNLASLHSRVMLLFGRQPAPIFAVGPHVRGFCPNGLKDVMEVGNVFKVTRIGGSGFYPFPAFMAKWLARLFPSFAICIFVLARKSGETPDYFKRLRMKSVESSFKGWTTD